MPVEWIPFLVPIYQTLIASGVTELGRRAIQSTAGTDQVTYSDINGLFTLQTMDAEAVREVLESEWTVDSLAQLPDGVTSERVREFLQTPEAAVLVHELMTLRILERPSAEIDLVRRNFNLTLGGFLAIHHVEAETVASPLFQALQHVLDAFETLLDTTEVNTRSSIQQLAGLGSIAASLRSIEHHLAASQAATSADRNEWRPFEEAYRNYVTRQHGVLIVSDADSERRIPIDRIYVEAALSLPDGEAFSLPESLKDRRRAVVTGSPGGGKSTLSGVVMHRLAQAPGELPFLVTLREYGADYAVGRPIVQHLERVLAVRTQRSVPDAWLESSLFSGRATVIFDGLDELLDPGKRREIRDAVEAFSDQYPAVRILVTSRIVGYEQAPLDPKEFVAVALGEFTEPAVRDYVKSWFELNLGDLDSGLREQRLTAFMTESESVHEIRRNPLMLSLMCVLYRGNNYIPESRLALYEECAKLLFKKWDRSRHLSIQLEIGQDIDAALMHLALWILTEGHDETGVTERKIVENCVDYLVPRRFDDREGARRAAEEFVSYCRGRAWVLADAGLNESQEALYTFTHRTFLEYFAASQIARVNGTPEAIASALVPFLAQEQFEVVAKLCLQIANRNHDDGADRLIRQLLLEVKRMDERSGLYILTFIAEATRTHVGSPALLRTVVDTVLEATLEMGETLAREVESRRDSFDSRSWSTPIAHLLACHTSNRDTVASRLEDLLQPYLVGFADVNTAQGDRAFIIAGFARVIARSAEPPDEMAYQFWGAWSEIQLTDVRMGPAFAVADHHPLVALVALEQGLIGLDPFFALGDLSVLFDMPSNPLGASRIATLQLLTGWTVGQYWEFVFRPGAPERILLDLAEMARTNRFPVRVDVYPSLIERFSELRSAPLFPAITAGWLILFCIRFELTRHRSPLAVLNQQVSEASEDIGSGRPQPPNYLTTINDQSRPEELILLDLLRAREGRLPRPTGVGERLTSLLPEDSEVASLLTSWSTGGFSFCVRPEQEDTQPHRN